MDDSLLSSSSLREHKPGMEWKTLERSKIRGWRADGKSYGQIQKMCGGKDKISCLIIQKIVKAPRSKRDRKGRAIKKKLLGLEDL